MDFMWKNGDLQFEDGDIAMNEDSVLQELMLRINTQKNTHYLSSDYGSYLSLRIGEPNTIILQNTIKDDIDDVLQQDSRIQVESVDLVFVASDQVIFNIYYKNQVETVTI